MRLIATWDLSPDVGTGLAPISLLESRSLKRTIPANSKRSNLVPSWTAMRLSRTRLTHGSEPSKRGIIPAIGHCTSFAVGRARNLGLKRSRRTAYDLTTSTLSQVTEALYLSGSESWSLTES